MNTVKEVIWLGNSKKLLLAFPLPVRKAIGYALHFAQEGILHPQAKPLKGLGNCIFEIVKNFDTDTYRTVYAVSKNSTSVYILHAFKKKSTSGIKTPRKEMTLIKERCKLMKELENDS